MSTPAQFARKSRRFADELERLPNQAVAGAALAVKNSVQRQLEVAGVRNNRLRGVGKKGARIAPKYTLTGDRAKVYMIGPAQFIEYDTRPHQIPRARKTKRAKKRYAVIPGVGVRAHVNHPGTKGKHPWRKGVTAAMPGVDEAAARQVSAGLRKAFRG